MIRHFEDGNTLADGKASEKERMRKLVEFEIKVWKSEGRILEAKALENVLKFIEAETIPWWKPEEIKQFFEGLHRPTGSTWEKQKKLLGIIYEGGIPEL